MKKNMMSVFVGLLTITLLNGCLALSVGSGKTKKPISPTVGQELIDLQRAKDSGAITDAEFEAQRARLLNEH